MTGTLTLDRLERRVHGTVRLAHLARYGRALCGARTTEPARSTAERCVVCLDLYRNGAPPSPRA